MGPRPRVVTSLALAALTVAAAATPAQAARWSRPQVVAGNGTPGLPVLAADRRGRLAVGYLRRHDRRYDAEVRTGTTARGVRGAPTVLAAPDGSSAVSLELRYVGTSGRATAGWATLNRVGRRVFAATLPPVRDADAVLPLAGPAADLADPHFVLGPGDSDPLLAWSREASVDLAGYTRGRFGVTGTVGLPRLRNETAVPVRDQRRTIVVAYTDDRGGLFTVTRSASGRLGAPQAIASPGYARHPQLAVTADGNVVLVWLASTGRGNVLVAASRPAKGDRFGPPLQVTGPRLGAAAPRLAPMPDGEVLVSFIASGSTRGYGIAPGPVDLLRLRGDATGAGNPIAISPRGERAFEAPHDVSATAGYVIWQDVRGDVRPLHVRRIARNGVVGALRTLSRHASAGLSAVVAAPDGRGAVAWAQHGRLLLARGS